MSGRVYGSRFAAIPEWLLCSEVSDRAVRLFAVLNRYAGVEGAAGRIERREIAERLKCSLASLDRAKAELVQAGALEVIPTREDNGDAGPNDYRLHFDQASPVMRGVLTGDEGGVLTGDEGSHHGRRGKERELLVREQEPRTTGPAASKPSRGTQLPATFTVDLEMRSWAQDNFPAVDIDAETEQFADHHRAKGSVMKDWKAAWRTWIRNAARFASQRAPTRPGGRPSTLDVLARAHQKAKSREGR